MDIKHDPRQYSHSLSDNIVANLKNQYAIGGGKESIDVVKIDDKHNIWLFLN